MAVHPMPPSAFELEEETRYETEFRERLRTEGRAEAELGARLLARGPIVLLPTCHRGHLMDWSEPQRRLVCLPCRNDRKRKARGKSPRTVIPHLGESVDQGHTSRSLERRPQPQPSAIAGEPPGSRGGAMGYGSGGGSPGKIQPSNS